MTHSTHKWGDCVYYPKRTERACTREGCKVVRVTCHEPGKPAREWWRDGKQLKSTVTPPCVGEIEVAAL